MPTGGDVLVPSTKKLSEKPGQHVVTNRGAGANPQRLGLRHGITGHLLDPGRAVQQSLRTRQQGPSVVVEQQAFTCPVE
jgi:hypothetical protein